jgi:iron complex outermembrane receptor protein
MVAAPHCRSPTVRCIGGHKNEFAAGLVLDYAQLNFLSGAQIGVINPQLFVEPSPWTVDTPESSPFGASPVNLKGVNRDFGAYLTDTLEVTSAFSLTASARYNSAAVDIQDLRGTALTGNNRFYHFNPAIGGTYKLLRRRDCLCRRRAEHAHAHSERDRMLQSA